MHDSGKRKMVKVMHKTEVNGRKNLVGLLIQSYRLGRKYSIRKMSEHLTVNGLEWDKNAVNQAELGRRVVTDIELLMLFRILGFSFKDLEDLL